MVTIEREYKCGKRWHGYLLKNIVVFQLLLIDKEGHAAALINLTPVGFTGAHLKASSIMHKVAKGYNART